MPDNASTRFALASMVPQIAPRANKKGYTVPVSHMPKIYFVKGFIQGAANQVALVIMQELKADQQAALKAEQQGAATLKVVASATETGSPTNI